jgi:hypothetical protein
MEVGNQHGADCSSDNLLIFACQCQGQRSQNGIVQPRDPEHASLNRVHCHVAMGDLGRSIADQEFVRFHGPIGVLLSWQTPTKASKNRGQR